MQIKEIEAIKLLLATPKKLQLYLIEIQMEMLWDQL